MPKVDTVVSVEFVTEESVVPDYLSEIEQGGWQLEGQAEPYDIPADLLDDYGDAQFEPLMVIAAAVSIGFLLKRISDMWMDHTRLGGQVVDVRGEKIICRWAPYLDRGKLVLVTEEGARVFEKQDHDEALRVLQEMAVGHG